MTQPWIPEQPITREMARNLIETQFRTIEIQELEPFGIGWDNMAFLLNHEIVFRFPHREMGADCMESEINVLPLVAERVPLPIPNPVYVGRAQGEYPWSFAGYSMIRGTTACRAQLNDQDRCELAAPLAAFLRALHSIPIDGLEQAGAIGDTLGRLDFDKRIPQTRERIDKIEELKVFDDVAALRSIVDDTEARYGTWSPQQITPRRVILHGDLYSRHLVVNENKRLAGLIDWGDTHLGNVAIDLSIAHMMLPATARETFRNTYGDIDDDMWRMARFRTVNHEVLTGLFALEIEDEDLVRECLVSLRYVAEQADSL